MESYCCCFHYYYYCYYLVWKKNQLCPLKVFFFSFSFKDATNLNEKCLNNESIIHENHFDEDVVQ